MDKPTVTKETLKELRESIMIMQNAPKSFGGGNEEETDGRQVRQDEPIKSGDLPKDKEK